MAYTYSPYEYKSTVGSQPVWSGEDWVRDGRSINWDANRQADYVERREQEKHQQFQDYAGEQFKGLFDIANVNPNPLKGFAQTPAYSPYGGTRADFTIPATSRYDMNADTTYNVPAIFDQKGYLDARFGNINDYLGGLSSFLGNMSGDSGASVRQGEIQRAMNRASMPTIGRSQPMGTPQMGGTSALSGFGGGGGRLVGKGWGSHPAFKGLLAGGGE